MTRIEHLELAEVVDAYRILPRVFMAGYGLLLWVTTFWFMDLEAPTAVQGTFVSILWGACAVITGWYFSTGRKWTS